MTNDFCRGHQVLPPAVECGLRLELHGGILGSNRMMGTDLLILSHIALGHLHRSALMPGKKYCSEQQGCRQTHTTAHPVEEVSLAPDKPLV
jgi:hypothetical protein